MVCDEKTISEVLMGNVNEYEKIIMKYDKRLYGFIYRIIGDEHAAQDITQETFIKAYENLGGFNFKKSFSTWIFTIAKNNAYNYLKRLRKNNMVPIIDELDDNEQETDTLIMENPEKALEKKLQAKYINDIMEKLSEKYRIIIFQKYVEDLSCKEISNKLCISEKAVESRLFRARQALIKIIDETEMNERQVDDRWTSVKQKERTANI